MKTRLAVGSFLVACAIFAILRNAEADPAILSETAYPSVAWKDFSPTIDLSSPPALRQTESIDLWDGMIFAKDRVVLPLRTAGGRVLWSWEPGKLPVRSEIQGDIQSIAYDDGKDEILILTTNKLLFLRRSSLAILRETPTSIQASDMGVSGKSLIARKRNDFTVYSLPDLQKLRTFSGPQAQFTQNKDPQRAIYLADGTILLNSTYWGAKLLRFHPDRPEIAREESISIPHRALLRFASTGKEDFVSFDPLTSTYAAYRYANGHYYEMTKGMQEFENFSAVRWAPREQNLKIEVVIETDASAKLAELLVLLPPLETYSQTLSGEALVQGSEIIRDRHGNRYAKLFVRLEAGVSRVIVYAATLRRYLFQADLTRFEDQLSRRQYPGFLKNYTADYKEFEIHNPIVESKKQEILSQAGASSRLFLEKTLSAAAAIPYKGDGRFDPAPVIISQNHGTYIFHKRDFARKRSTRENRLGLAASGGRHRIQSQDSGNVASWIWLDPDGIAQPSARSRNHIRSISGFRCL
ncbi:MAG: hypothetical protein K1X70_20530 [Leptospirales bacterium]|nr:hypothetical protein [Leptospirales bacterium]